jgi:hypothetical protein
MVTQMAENSRLVGFGPQAIEMWYMVRQLQIEKGGNKEGNAQSSSR